ncbi:hypothetical protein VNO77_01624 [Canavalia gladiata]|uniref:Uncharacterized protein n=1 Tax=Canavalia gladiata TaxID=3824 RepID=A0AAN9MWR6_CANGL
MERRNVNLLVWCGWKSFMFCHDQSWPKIESEEFTESESAQVSLFNFVYFTVQKGRNLEEEGGELTSHKSQVTTEQKPF